MKRSAEKNSEDVDQGELPDLVGYHLRRAQKAVFGHFSDSLSEVGISPGQFGVLTLIDANQGLSQSALAKILGIERSTMVAVIDRLETQNWVERKVSKTDRRSYALALTQAGTALLGQVRPLVVDHEAQISAGLSDTEKAQLIDFLDRVTAATEC